MKLVKISIKNYRSIENLDFEISKVNNSYTYSLLGINESGKSSFLKALSLYDLDQINYPLDYFDDTKSVQIIFKYILTPESLEELNTELSSKNKFEKDLIDQIKIKSISIKSEFKPSPNATSIISEDITFEKNNISDYTLNGEIPRKKEKEDKKLKDFNLIGFFKNQHPRYFWNNSHHVVLWKASSEYLMLDDIDLNKFSSNPKDVSIPLLNCFRLAGINESSIKNEISKLNTPVNISSLQGRLSEATTTRINSVWPEHPISITFLINNNKISLLIEDNGVKFQPKTTNQRSDGFKQFISFLLTISTESYNNELKNTILLIDEPETHLHPPAQINLLKELIKITSNHNNNILFFATHSNYLIDKNNLDRNYKVKKKSNQITSIEKVLKKTSSYSEVNYDIFGIDTTDYHNELYGYIESENKSLLDEIPKERKWQNAKTEKTYDVSLSEYIRHSIHHPENKLNEQYSDKELNISIKILKKLKERI